MCGGRGQSTQSNDFELNNLIIFLECTVKKRLRIKKIGFEKNTLRNSIFSCVHTFVCVCMCVCVYGFWEKKSPICFLRMYVPGMRGGELFNVNKLLEKRPPLNRRCAYCIYMYTYIFVNIFFRFCFLYFPDKDVGWNLRRHLVLTSRTCQSKYLPSRQPEWFFFLLSKPMSSLVTDRRKHSPTSSPPPKMARLYAQCLYNLRCVIIGLQYSS